MTGSLLENWTIYEGDSITFNCSFKSGPESSIVWYKSKIESQQNQNYMINGRYFILNNVNINNSDLYVCNATNIFGSSLKKFKLNVLEGKQKMIMVKCE